MSEVPRVGEMLWLAVHFAPGFSSRPCANNIVGVPAVVTSFPEISTIDQSPLLTRRDDPLETREKMILITWFGPKVLISGGVVTYPPEYRGGGGGGGDLSKTATATFTGNDRSQ